MREPLGALAVYPTLAYDWGMPQYDRAERRRAQRNGRERGVRIYVPAEELERMGIDPSDPSPLFYRLWGSSTGAGYFRLYREPSSTVSRRAAEPNSESCS